MASAPVPHAGEDGEEAAMRAYPPGSPRVDHLLDHEAVLRTGHSTRMIRDGLPSDRT